MTAWLHKGLPEGAADWAPRVLAYVAVFLVIYLAFLALTLLLEQGVKVVQMQWLNRALGALLGALKAGLILGLALLGAVHFLPDASGAAVDRSELAPFLTEGVRRLFDTIPEHYREQVTDQLRLLEGLAQGGQG